MVQNSLRELVPNRRSDVSAVAGLHLQLLGHGPMARLGKTFLEEFCYKVLIRDGLMKAALYEVDGKPAGFIAYTRKSITFHRFAIRKHLVKVICLVLVSILHEPKVLFRLPKAFHLMINRRAEIGLAKDPLGEVVAIGVLPEFRTPRFIRKTGLRISQDLVEYAISYFQRTGVEKMRMIVEAHNKATLLFYHSLGATLVPYEQIGEPMTIAWFNLGPLRNCSQ